jgi:hypothetical protein
MGDRDSGVESPSNPTAPIEQPKTTFETPERSSGVAPTSDQAKSPWGQVIGLLTPLVLTAGIIIYGILSFGYDRFYSRLGIDPAVVGLSYTSVLSRATGFVAALLVPVIVSSVFFIRNWRRRVVIFGGWVSGMIMVGLLFFLSLEYFGSADAAGAVKAGRPVAPLTAWGMTALAIHADPVRIEAAGKVGEVPAIDRLVNRIDLLYIGQANGIVVLYDSSAQSALYLPSASIVMTESNCATKRSSDPRCKRRYSP